MTVENHLSPFEEVEAETVIAAYRALSAEEPDAEKLFILVGGIMACALLAVRPERRAFLLAAHIHAIGATFSPQRAGS